MRRPTLAALAPAALALVLASACAGSRLEKRLDPDSRTFLSQVRYLISRGERKIFLNLPAAERAGFVERFWTARDPTPETPENEFKTRYYERIQEANHLFSGGAAPGWLQDRGRIWILLGRPDNRETYPRGMSFYDLPTEIWYYGFFPIVFRDPDWSGDYRLDPLSANQIGEIMSAQMQMKPQADGRQGKLRGDFRLAARQGGVALRLSVPFKSIELAEDDAGVLTGTLKVSLSVKPERGGAEAWSAAEEIPISHRWQELEGLEKSKIEREWTIALAKGGYVLSASVENPGDGSRVFRTIPFRVDRRPSP